MSKPVQSHGPTLTPEQVREVRRASRIALDLARVGAWKSATAGYQDIHDRYGMDGLFVALVATADAVITHLGPSPPGAVVMPLWQHPITGAPQLADAVEPRWRWAGWWIAARARDDYDDAMDLIAMSTTDELGDRVTALIALAAATLGPLEHGPAQECPQ